VAKEMEPRKGKLTWGKKKFTCWVRNEKRNGALGKVRTKHYISTLKKS